MLNSKVRKPASIKNMMAFSIVSISFHIFSSWTNRTPLFMRIGAYKIVNKQWEVLEWHSEKWIPKLFFPCTTFLVPISCLAFKVSSNWWLLIGIYYMVYILCHLAFLFRIFTYIFNTQHIETQRHKLNMDFLAMFPTFSFW